MGQPSCCGADRSDQEFIMHLNVVFLSLRACLPRTQSSPKPLNKLAAQSSKQRSCLAEDSRREWMGTSSRRIR